MIRTVETTAMDAAAAVAGYLARSHVVCVLRFALNGDIQVINGAMSSHLGIADSSATHSVFDVLTEPDARTLRRSLDAPAALETALRLNFCDSHGEPFTLLSFLTVYPDGGLIIGEPVLADERLLQRQLVELNEELAALARTRQRLAVSQRRARQLAEAHNRGKDEGLAVIAHELRQPLNSAKLALAAARTPANLERGMQIVDRQLDHMGRLIEDLLHASQVMRGAIVLDRELADLAEVVREAVEFVTPTVQERHQIITLAAAGGALPVEIDTKRIRQVLTNILSNAVKYTPHGGSIMVSLTMLDAAHCDVVVRDTGDGISADALANVFELFVRGTTGGNGLGIGLAVAKRLVELHGGTLTAESEGLGKGSQFVIRLPAVAQPAL